MFSHLDVEAYDREYSDVTLAKRAVRYFVPHRREVAVVVASVVALASLGAGVPMLIAQGVDMLGGRREELLDALGVAVLLAGVLVWAVNYLRRRLTVAVIGDIVLALRRDAFRAAVHHDMSFYDRYSSGRVVTRITSDTNDFGQTVVLVTELVSQILVMMILAVVLWSISPRLTVILLAWAPVVVVLAAGFRRVARYVTRQGARAMAEVNAKVFETVSGIAVAKNFRREAAIWEEFTAVNRLSYRINVRRGLVLATVFPVLNILVGIGTATIVYAGGLEA
ncbi:MAG: ABC transporter transmembrane domain-containing protein, partial [Anaerolineae bacterium]